jgi:hypothetical protein
MIAVENILELHRQTVSDWHQAPMENRFSEGSFLWSVCQQHQFNFLLWHEEDIARSPDVSDEEIARVKRSIDGYNQRRNDWIEKVDDFLTELLQRQGVQPSSSARMNTETPGSAIDRLSILALRIYHLAEQLERQDVDQEHLQRVGHRLAICQAQHGELAGALQDLLDDLFAGRKRHRTYRQLKMYNDPTLNPYLYRHQSADAAHVRG